MKNKPSCKKDASFKDLGGSKFSTTKIKIDPETIQGAKLFIYFIALIVILTANDFKGRSIWSF